MAVSARMSCLICVYTVSTAIHLHCSGVHLRAARTCRARFSCREYVLWHCVHTCICRRQGKRVRVQFVWMVGEEMQKGGGMEEALVEWKSEGGGQAGGKAELGVAFGSLSRRLGGVTIARVGLYYAV